MKVLFACVLVALCATLMVTAYPGGAPVIACGDMTPQHNVSAQETPSPYKLTLSQERVEPGAVVTATLSAAPGESFLGFFIQARQDNVPVGTFEMNDQTKTIDCGDGTMNAATHVNRNPKTSVTVEWTAPSSPSDNIVFTYSVVREASVFWVLQTVSPITVIAN